MVLRTTSGFGWAGSQLSLSAALAPAKSMTQARAALAIESRRCVFIELRSDIATDTGLIPPTRLSSTTTRGLAKG
jgi:hypothetical protein